MVMVVTITTQVRISYIINDIIPLCVVVAAGIVVVVAARGKVTAVSVTEVARDDPATEHS